MARGRQSAMNIKIDLDNPQFSSVFFNVLAICKTFGLELQASKK